MSDPRGSGHRQEARALASDDGFSLLVVEHIQSTRELLALVLRRRYRVQTAATYEQALRRARATRFDGMLIGVTRGRLQAGVNVIEGLQALQGDADVPLIVVIGPSIEDERGTLVDAGGDGFLRMPFVQADLFWVLHSHLGGKEV